MDMFSEPSIYSLLTCIALCLIAAGLVYDAITIWLNRSKPIRKEESGHDIGNWEQERTAGEDDEDTVKVPRRVIVQLQEEVSSLKRIITNVTEVIESNNRQ